MFFQLCSAQVRTAGVSEGDWFKYGLDLDWDYDLDESPEVFGLEKQARPVEMTHPDLVPNPAPHRFKVHNFVLSWHDVFHTWRAGCNMHKPLARYLRTMLEDAKGYSMSKAIWKLTDLDYTTSDIRREMADSKNSSNGNTNRRFLSNVLEGVCNKSFGEEKLNDDALILLADFVENKEKWNKMLGEDPNKLIAGILFGKDSKAAFSKHCKAMQKIVEKNPARSKKFYVLAFRLKAVNPKKVNLCDELEKSDVLKWSRNKGLYFLDDGNKKQFIEDFDSDKELLRALKNKLDPGAEVAKGCVIS